MTATHRICHNVVPIYDAPETSGEQISQLIWGESVRVLESMEGFARVLGEDHYDGWLRSRFIIPLNDDQDSATSTIATLFGEVYCRPDAGSELVTRLTTGARVVLSRRATISGFIPIDLFDGSIGYIHQSQISISYSSWMPEPRSEHHGSLSDLSRTELHRQVRSLQLDRIRHSSLLFIGVPYLWGGTTPFGMDCSGFTRLVYKIAGIQLLRDASLQRIDSRFNDVDSFAGLKETSFERSDLLFFNSDKSRANRTTHVGLALGDGRFVHSAGRGRGTIVTSCGDEDFLTTFVGARRLKPDANLRLEPI